MERLRDYTGMTPLDSSYLYLVVGVFGCLLYLVLISTFVLLPRIQSYHPAARLVIFHVGCSFMVSLGLIFSFFLNFWIAGSTLWYLMLSLDLLIALINPWIHSNSKTICYHISVWSISLGSSCLLWNGNMYGLSALNLCWIRRTKAAKEINEMDWALLFVPLLLVFVVSSMVLLFASVRFARRQQDLTHRTKRRNLLQYFRYLVAFGLCWGSAGLFYYLDYRKSFDSYPLHIGFGLTLAIYPLFILLVWSANTDLIEQLTTYRKETEETPVKEMDHFSAALRKDLMYYSAAGILEGSRSGDQTRSTNDAYAEKRRRSNYVYLHGDRNQHYEKLGFTDYAPDVFRSIRHACGITAASYEQTFLNRHLQERASEGKSGMLFYFTADKKYVVKTMSKKEHEFFLKILPTYHKYIQDHPQTLLCRFIGCHSMQLPVGWNKIFFVVMENVFPDSDIDERYDLKGNVNDHEPKQQPMYREIAHLQGTLFHDLEFIENVGSLRINSETRIELLAQMTSDCEFLKNLNILDYSFLVGMRKINHLEDHQQLQHLPRNALISPDFTRVYYIGFVDILQHYNLGWKLQNFFTSLLRDKKNRTALPPADYALRFLSFLHKHLLHDPATSNAPRRKMYGSFGYHSNTNQPPFSSSTTTS